MLKDFKPALFFLGKFLGIYIVGNVLYGLYIGTFPNQPDPVTSAVTAQSSWCMNLLGQHTSIRENEGKASIAILEGTNSVVSVFEGCNGVNVMVIFVAFIVAFGGPGKVMAWFIPLGIAVIHLINLGRIALLYFTARDYAEYFYYVHKYFFTAILYVIVFLLWAVWVFRVNKVDIKGKG